MATQKSGFGTKSCTAHKQECVFGVFKFQNYSVLDVVTINGLNLQTVLFTGLITLQNQGLQGNPFIRLYTCLFLVLSAISSIPPSINSVSKCNFPV